MENLDKAKRKTAPKYSAEVRERAVRMVFEHRAEYATQWEAIQSIAAKMGCSRETLRNWVRQAESDRGLRSGPKTQERIASASLNVKSGNCVRPMKSCARPRRISHRRSSTADRSDDRLH